MSAVFIAIVLWGLTAQSGSTGQPLQVLSSSIRATLDAKFPGWRLAEPIGALRDFVAQRSPGSHPSLLVGDFDGNGQADYALLIEHTNFDRRGKAFSHVKQTLVFLAGTQSFTLIALNEPSPADGCVYLTLRKKGTEGFDFEANRKFFYPSDSIGYSFFEKAASGTYIYTNGAFRYVTEAD
jgi:hypothetical protein